MALIPLQNRIHYHIFDWERMEILRKSRWPPYHTGTQTDYVLLAISIIHD